MMLLLSISVIFCISFLLALKAAREEFRIPAEIKKLKIIKKKPIAGVILFLKEKIIHYSSSAS